MHRYGDTGRWLSIDIRCLCNQPDRALRYWQTTKLPLVYASLLSISTAAIHVIQSPVTSI